MYNQEANCNFVQIFLLKSYVIAKDLIDKYPFSLLCNKNVFLTLKENCFWEIYFTTKTWALTLVEVCDEGTKHLHSRLILILYIKYGGHRYIDKAVGKVFIFRKKRLQK